MPFSTYEGAYESANVNPQCEFYPHFSFVSKGARTLLEWDSCWTLVKQRLRMAPMKNSKKSLRHLNLSLWLPVTTPFMRWETFCSMYRMISGGLLYSYVGEYDSLLGESHIHPVGLSQKVCREPALPQVQLLKEMLLSYNYSYVNFVLLLFEWKTEMLMVWFFPALRGA